MIDKALQQESTEEEKDLALEQLKEEMLDLIAKYLGEEAQFHLEAENEFIEVWIMKEEKEERYLH